MLKSSGASKHDAAINNTKHLFARQSALYEGDASDLVGVRTPHGKRSVSEWAKIRFGDDAADNEHLSPQARSVIEGVTKALERHNAALRRAVGFELGMRYMPALEFHRYVKREKDLAAASSGSPSASISQAVDDEEYEDDEEEYASSSDDGAEELETEEVEEGEQDAPSATRRSSSTSSSRAAKKQEEKKPLSPRDQRKADSIERSRLMTPDSRGRTKLDQKLAVVSTPLSDSDFDEDAEVDGDAGQEGGYLPNGRRIPVSRLSQPEPPSPRRYLNSDGEDTGTGTGSGEYVSEAEYRRQVAEYRASIKPQPASHRQFKDKTGRVNSNFVAEALLWSKTAPAGGAGGAAAKVARQKLE